jgi:cholera toxin transcriptional activator
MANGRLIRFGLYEAKVESGELFKNGQKLRLQEQPFQVLVALLERPGEVVTREELQQRVWPSDTFVDFEHSLNTAVLKVRDALGDTAGNPRFVETLPRRGYRFIAPVQVVGETAAVDPAADKIAMPVTETSVPTVSPTGAVADEERDEELPRASRPVSRWLFGALQLMYLIFYVTALWRLQEIEDIRALQVGVSGGVLITIILVTGAVGIVLRLYTLSATVFDYPRTGINFQRMFLWVLLLDVIWAMSPLLMTHILGLGLAFGACAALVYSPFAQRTLAWMAWGKQKSVNSD